MRDRAGQLLKQALEAPRAEFRDGQWECIEALLNRRRMLVVQRTGWGKSMVYFLATRMLRDQGAGVSLLITALLRKPGCPAVFPLALAMSSTRSG